MLNRSASGAPFRGQAAANERGKEESGRGSEHYSQGPSFNQQQSQRVPASMIPPKLHPSIQTTGTNSAEDLSEFVQSMIQEMQSRFQTLSDSIVNRIDDVGAKLDSLEEALTALIEADDAGGDPQ
eukprot:GHVU01217680.1.p1 GENE.GHVU01217680.1~~GHVU01217680.1.p1  ORF type:complete len:125 (+),score=17.95 GHVU01217680.1:63-437(+)